MEGLISADALRADMYQEVFEKDSDMQKWDGGCWMRFKLFENVMSRQPAVDAVTVVRCNECKSNCRNEDGSGWCKDARHYGMATRKDFFCADGDRE